MRIIIALAMGMMMLMSAAFAESSGNSVVVDVSSYLSDNTLVGAGVAQLSDVETNLQGSNIESMQEMMILGCNNVILGDDPLEAFLLQVGIEKINDSGCNDFDLQTQTLLAAENYVNNGKINQLSLESANVKGSDNVVYQNALNAPFSNSLEDSELQLASASYANIDGIGNGVDQTSLLTSAGNSLIGSHLFQIASLNSDIHAINTFGSPSYNVNQMIIETSASNELVDSWVAQSAYMNAVDMGVGNFIDQEGSIGLLTNYMNKGIVLQKLKAEAASKGSFNGVLHNVDMQNFNNCLIDGIFIQDAGFKTSV